MYTTFEKKEFTKNEKDILSKRELSGDNFILKNDFVTVVKRNKDEYCAEFKYPDSFDYIGLSAPACTFEKLLDTISKFKIYHNN